MEEEETVNSSSIYSYKAEIMTEEEENTQPDSSWRLLFEERQYISSW
jgi:hypothetical protein